MLPFESCLILALLPALIRGLNHCGNWTQYNDIKCFKVLEKNVTEEEALTECYKLDKKSTLITIHSKEEQEFLNNLLLKYNKISINVWIGMKYSDKTYHWMDGSESNFINWENDAVKDGTDPCVQMSLLNHSMGKWTDISCKKKALIVCQKRQELTLNVLKDVIESQQNQLNSLIPWGFIYTQFPNQSPPYQLWPHLRWTEVTREYSGLFFRAEGTGSLTFGQIQQANYSRISNVNLIGWNVRKDGYSGNPVSVSINKNGWTSIHADGVHDHVDIFTTGAENRPRNTAIRIWQRVN